MSLSNKISFSLIAGTFCALLAWVLVDFTPLYSTTVGRINYGPLWQLVLAQAPVTGLFGFLVGLGVGFINGLSSGSPARLWKNVTSGALYGLLGGIVSITFGQAIFGSLYIDPSSGSAPSAASPLIFLWDVIVRALGWALIGIFIGVSQGLSTGSPKAARHGAVGGLIGGLIGGMLLEILPYVPPFGENHGVLARGVSFAVTGAFIGLFIGLVQTLMKQAWIRVAKGRNEGTEFIISKQRTTIGRDELSDIGLFGDHTISPNHAVIDAMPGGRHVLRDAGSKSGTVVNGNKITDHALRDGEIIEITSVKLEFHEKATMSRVPKRSDVMPLQIPMGPNQCPFCGTRKHPVTGACACTVSDQQPPPAQLPQPGFGDGMPPQTQFGQMPQSSMPQTQTFAPPQPSIADGIPRLTAVGGPYIGQKFQLERSGVTTIGREGGQSINLPVDTTISRRHARVANEGGRFVVYDEGSSNGTTVNGMRITRAELNPGDTVAFGSSAFRFEI